MKRKILTLFFTFLIIISNSFSTFANPLVATSISYELLMALMGIGVSFGLSLPKDDSQYWDYTNSLKKHLQVVDDDYLELLDKSVKEWKINNNNKPDNEKEPLKIPFIPNLKTLFDNIGDDVSFSYTYYNHLLNPIPVISNTQTDLVNLNYTYLPGDNNTVISYSLPTDENDVYFKKSDRLIFSNNINFKGAYSTSGFVEDNNENTNVSLFVHKNKIYSATTNFSEYAYSSISSVVNVDVSSLTSYKKESISYTPSDPSLDNNEIVLPNGLPNINIPNVDTIPGYEEGLNPPFDVNPPINTDTPPGTDTDTPPGTDTDTFLPSFPSFGDSLDFSPMYLTNVTEKFPFSLPWDIGRLIQKFDVEPQAPIFDVPIVSETITLDLTEFSELASIVRFFVLIGFILSLIFISTKLMA